MPDDTDPPADTVDAPEADTTATPPALSLEDMARELDKTRKEAARYRTKAKQLEEKQTAEAEAKRTAAQTLEERYTELERKYQEKESEAEAIRRDATDRISLAGRVSDIDYALYKIGKEPKYRGENGSINVDALLADVPTLATTPAPKPGPAPTKGGGEPDFNAGGMNNIIRQKAGRA